VRWRPLAFGEDLASGSRLEHVRTRSTLSVAESGGCGNHKTDESPGAAKFKSEGIFPIDASAHTISSLRQRALLQTA